MNNLLIFPHKQLRAAIIKEYLARSRYNKVVCFSCGNAVKALKEAGVDTLYIGDNGDFKPSKWFTPSDINYIFPEYFDATSGHLSIEIMLAIAESYKNYLGELNDDIIYVPTGSGETVFCLKLAYPQKKFVAVYNLNDATRYDEENPFNKIVEIICEQIVKN